MTGGVVGTGRAVSLAYGGRVVRFQSKDPDVELTIDRVREAFRVGDDAEPRCVVDCSVGQVTPPETEPHFGNGRLWDLHRLPEGGEEVCFYNHRPNGHREPLLSLRFCPSFRRVELRHVASRPGNKRLMLGSPMDEYLMCRLLGREGGIVLHAAALRVADGAVLFCGHSGAGKSTISEIGESLGAEVLSDDRTILDLSNGSPHAWGTPWHGSYRRGLPIGVPIRGIFLLVQSSADQIKPVTPSVALKELFVRLILPTCDAQETTEVVGTLEAIVGQVPVAELHFRPTSAAFDLATRFVAETSA